MGLRQVPPGIKDTNLRQFLAELRAAVGGVSDQVTKLVQTRSTSSSGGGGGGGGTDPGTNPPVNPSPGGNGYPPPAPTSLTATADVWAINLAWSNPVIPDYLGTEIWAKRTFPTWSSATRYYVNAKVLYSGVVYRAKKGNDASGTSAVNNTNFAPSSSADWWEATTLTVMADRVKVAEVAGLAYTFTGLTSELLTPGETWAFWVRNHDTEDLYSTYFPADDDGVSATTLLDPGAYIDLLTGAIKDTQLYKDLGDRIDLIDAGDYIPGSVNARLKAVQLDLDTQIGANGSAIIDLQETTAEQATAITALGTRTTSAESSIINLQTTAAGQATSISTLGTRTTAAESNITNLQTTTANQATSISSLTTRTSSAESNITNLQTTTANQATSISNLTSTVSGHTTSISTQATSIDGLKAQYTVKIDNNGWVSGFGLASTTQSDGTVISDFGIRADRFWIAPPTNPLNNTGGLGIPLVDTGSGIVVRYYTYTSAVQSGSTWVQGTTVRRAFIQMNADHGLVANQWFALKDIRDSFRQNRYVNWNQSFLVLATSHFLYDEWVVGTGRVQRSTASLTGAGAGSYVIFIELNTNESNGYTTNTTTGENSDAAKLVPESYLPFIVTTTTRLYNGVPIPPGVFINNAFIATATITEAKIANAAITNAKIADAAITNAKIGNAIYGNFNGTFDGSGFISAYGTSGWAIDKNGTAVFNDVIVRSGANVGANALSWGKFYEQLTNNDSSLSNSFTHTGGSAVYQTICWTPYQGTQASQKLVVPYATGRTTTIACSLSIETPVKQVGRIGNQQFLTVSNNQINLSTALWLGSCDGVKLELMNGAASLGSKILFEANERDILARFFSGQCAFSLTAAQAAALTNPHIRVIVRHTNTGNQVYDNVRLFVQAFVS